MEKTYVDAQKDGCEKEDSLLSLPKETDVAEGHKLEVFESKTKNSLRRVNPEQMLLNAKKSPQARERCFQSFLPSYGTNFRIPKHMVSQDVKYLNHCLELLQVRASNSLSLACMQEALLNVSVDLMSSNGEVIFHGVELPKSRRTNTFDCDRIVMECQSAAGPGAVAVSPVGQRIVGTISGNNNMRSILKNPLYDHLGALDSLANLHKAKTVNFKESKSYDFMSSSVRSTSSPQKLQKENVLVENQRYGSDVMHKRLASISSTSSICSEKSSSSSGVMISQGMIKSIWKNGLPHFMFSVDDQREVYVANLWKVESSDDKALDYMYSFHSIMEGKNETWIHDRLLKLVGKMKVSTSVTLCLNNSELTEETEFVLFGSNEKQFGDTQSSVPASRKNEGLPKKMVEVFKTNHLIKDRTNTRSGQSSATCEDFSWEPCQDTFSKLNALSRDDILKDDLPPNLELSAIVVKDYLHDSCPERTEGGWGLKFLKKAKVEHSTTSLEVSTPESCQESCIRNRSDCSTSVSVLIPSGLHGGPTTRNGGPSSLTERWRSGGHCDCGGWDIGCPITVLNNASSLGVLHQMDAQGQCKSFDLSLQGTKQGVPALKMVCIHDGLYVIHFESTLSALQSFSIAVAVLHMQFPNLRQKMQRL